MLAVQTQDTRVLLQVRLGVWCAMCNRKKRGKGGTQRMLCNIFAITTTAPPITHSPAPQSAACKKLLIQKIHVNVFQYMFVLKPASSNSSRAVCRPPTGKSRTDVCRANPQLGCRTHFSPPKILTDSGMSRKFKFG